MRGGVRIWTAHHFLAFLSIAWRKAYAQSPLVLSRFYFWYKMSSASSFLLRLRDWSSLKARASFISKKTSQHWLLGHSAHSGSNDVSWIKSISAGFAAAASLRWNTSMSAADDEANTSLELSNCCITSVDLDAAANGELGCLFLFLFCLNEWVNHLFWLTGIQ